MLASQPPAMSGWEGGAFGSSSGWGARSAGVFRNDFGAFERRTPMDRCGGRAERSAQHPEDRFRPRATGNEARRCGTDDLAEAVSRQPDCERRRAGRVWNELDDHRHREGLSKAEAETDHYDKRSDHPRRSPIAAGRQMLP